jgi:hypothetical protein
LSGTSQYSVRFAGVDDFGSEVDSFSQHNVNKKLHLQSAVLVDLDGATIEATGRRATTISKTTISTTNVDIVRTIRARKEGFEEE